MQSLKILPIHEASAHKKQIAEWLHAEWGSIRSESVEDTLLWIDENHSETHGFPHILVALEDGVPVGTASLVTEDMTIRPNLTPWLASVYVTPSARAKGVATRLVKEILSVAQNCGFERVFLFTTSHTSLYRRMGWRRLERTVYREESAEVMSYDFHIPNNISPDRTSIEFAKYALDYAYKLKSESNARAQAIITSNTLFIGATAIAASVMTNMQLSLDPTKFFFWVFLVSAIVGVLSILTAQFIVMRVYSPIVLDSESPLEPEWLVKNSADEIATRLSKIDFVSATDVYIQEARAVSAVQIDRANKVRKSARAVTVALISIAIALFGIIVHTTFLI